MGALQCGLEPFTQPWSCTATMKKKTISRYSHTENEQLWNGFRAYICVASLVLTLKARLFPPYAMAGSGVVSIYCNQADLGRRVRSWDHRLDSKAMERSVKDFSRDGLELNVFEWFFTRVIFNCNLTCIFLSAPIYIFYDFDKVSFISLINKRRYETWVIKSL